MKYYLSSVNECLECALKIFKFVSLLYIINMKMKHTTKHPKAQRNAKELLKVIHSKLRAPFVCPLHSQSSSVGLPRGADHALPSP